MPYRTPIVAAVVSPKPSCRKGFVDGRLSPKTRLPQLAFALRIIQFESLTRTCCLCHLNLLAEFGYF